MMVLQFKHHNCLCFLANLEMVAAFSRQCRATGGGMQWWLTLNYRHCGPFSHIKMTFLWEYFNEKTVHFETVTK